MSSRLPSGESTSCHIEPDLLTLYVDDRATPAERQRIEDHLVSCQACRDAAADEFAIVGLLGGLASEPAPRSFRVGPGLRRAAPGGDTAPIRAPRPATDRARRRPDAGHG